MKTLRVTYGPKHNSQTVQVQLLGELEDSPLTPQMARRAARIATGGTHGVMVMGVEYGYILYSEKRNSHRKVFVEEANNLEIHISYTEDAMLGADEDNRDGVDIVASFAKFEEMLTDALEKHFPGADVEIVNGIEDYHRIWPDDMESPDRNVELGEIVHNVWESWDWVVVEVS